MQQQPLMVNLYATWTRDNQATRIGAANYGEAFDEAITGLQTGDKKDVSVTYPDDFKTPDLQGKNVVDFNIEVVEVRERNYLN